MNPKVVSFDCAQTLLEVDWSLKRYIADVCAEVGLEIPLEGPALYEAMYHEQLSDYIRCNMARDHAICDRWWLDFGANWLTRLGMDPALAAVLQAASERIGFGPNSILFRLYEDVIPTLDSLRQKGIRLAVLSNWDYSLLKSLRGAGIAHYFDLVVASLEYGVEKPDPRLFAVIGNHFEVEPHEVFHVGDHEVDDYSGARAFGMRAALIDRTKQSTEEPILHDLRHIEGAFHWIG